jgi:putative flavoprotein involved in K+ transport
MKVSKIDTLIVGGGQAGLAMSAHLAKLGLPHLIIERDRVAESWRSRRWDTLVANGPAWHDRFADLEFSDIDPNSFATKDRIVAYFETFARQIDAPIREGVAVTSVSRKEQDGLWRIETSNGVFEAHNVVFATGPFQKPNIPPIVPVEAGLAQIHSNDYRNPDQIPAGAVLVVGAGSSGVQIADELVRSGRQVYLSVGPHNRPPRRYRGKDFCWWLGALGHWNVTEPLLGKEHVTIAVSGARGGHTVDFRELASRGVVLLGRAEAFSQGRMRFASDLRENIAMGDADYRSVLDQADAYVEQHGLDFPEELSARDILPDPVCITDPIVDLASDDVGCIIWATGYSVDFSWVDAKTFDDRGMPIHKDGVSSQSGLFFLGLPWLTRRASAFIWGVWHDAEGLAARIAERSVGAAQATSLLDS